jgi:sucrose phosphorylase
LEYLLPKITFHKITVTDLKSIANPGTERALYICEKVNKLIDENLDLQTLDLGNQSVYKDEVLPIVNRNRSYLGQMDVNAKSALV